MAALIHEIWEMFEDGMLLHACCFAGSYGDAFRETLPADSRLLITFVADCHFDAMTIYYQFLGWGLYSTRHQEDFCSYPEEWLQSQPSAQAPIHPHLGEFTRPWFELGMVNNELMSKLVSQRDPEDNHPEHFRFAAFQQYIASNRPLSLELCWRLYELGSDDVDLGMGGSMMTVILRLPECPRELLTAGLGSTRKHIVRTAAQCLAAKPLN